VLCSEFLKDRHPYLDQPFNSKIDPAEVAVAYGRRGVAKLLDVLRNTSLAASQYVLVRTPPRNDVCPPFGR
jgi:hypothetical protein